MKAIHKYLLSNPTEEGAIKINLPFEAEILTIQEQHGAVYLWALVDTENVPYKERIIKIVGTGHATNFTNAKYITTLQFRQGHLIFHFFDMTP